MAEEIKENFETGADNTALVGDWTGSEFINAVKIVNSNDIKCTGVSIYIESENGAVVGNLTFRLETDNGGEPSGVLVHANATYDMAPGAVTIPGWNRAVYTQFVLPAGTYWLVISVPAQANNVWYAWTSDANNCAACRCYNINGGAWITNNDELYFRLYGLIEIAIDALFFGAEF